MAEQAKSKKLGPSQAYDLMVDAIIRPPRFVYDIADLGSQKMRMGNLEFIRNDLELVNPRGLTIQCSLYEMYRPSKSISESEPSEKRPVVIYCHGNSGSRLDGMEAVKVLLPICSVFTFDFSGCGLSQGEYISLGHYEQEDLATVVNYLRSTNKVSRIGLWGRSMGAVTSIFYASKDPSIAAMVLDSPFANLRRLCEELSKKFVKIPKMMVSMGLTFIKRTVKNKAKFDIDDLDPIQLASTCFVPAFFCHGEGDEFILPKHSQDIYDKYCGDKNLIFIEGDHNSVRPDFFYDSVSIFFQNLLFDKDEKPNHELGIEEALSLMRNLGVQSPLKGRETLETLEADIVNEGILNEHILQEFEDEEEMLRKAIEMSLQDDEKSDPTEGSKEKDLISFDD